jgi:hypothetical protein
LSEVSFISNTIDVIGVRSFTEDDISGSGSDRLIDAHTLRGSPTQIFDQLDEHLRAGANHVGIQVLTEERGASPMAEYRALAQHFPART